MLKSSQQHTQQRSRSKRHASQPRAVLVTRSTEYEWLLERHATPQQAKFFLSKRQQSIDVVQDKHHAFSGVRQQVSQAIPVDWRRAHVGREDLDRFLFEPGDVIIVLGPDGLVANVAKYLDGQPVIGLNPDPERNEGVLVPHPPEMAEPLLHATISGGARFQERSMVHAVIPGGEKLLALNEIFVGHRTHQSAKYQIDYRDQSERHSSSGLIVTTGTGATGWARSISRERPMETRLPEPEERGLVFLVREAWPSVYTQTDCTVGWIDDGERLEITSRMDNGIIFGDGVESDCIEFGWGRRVQVALADRVLRLVVG